MLSYNFHAKFEEEVESYSLSICGYGPIAAALHFSILTGCKSAFLLRYTNSGKETNGDERQVVAYASFAIF
jgi:AmmeMemoRadiSam system protein B